MPLLASGVFNLALINGFVKQRKVNIMHAYLAKHIQSTLNTLQHALSILCLP